VERFCYNYEACNEFPAWIEVAAETEPEARSLAAEAIRRDTHKEEESVWGSSELDDIAEARVRSLRLAGREPFSVPCVLVNFNGAC